MAVAVTILKVVVIAGSFRSIHGNMRETLSGVVVVGVTAAIFFAHWLRGSLQTAWWGRFEIASFRRDVRLILLFEIGCKR